MLREHLSITSTHKYHVCYSRTPASNQSTEDLVHVSMKNDKSNFVCANGSGCSRFRIKISKKRTTASLCPHEHIVQLMSGKTAENSEEVPQEQEQVNIFDNHVWLENTSKFLFSHRQLELSDSNIKRIEKLVLERNKLDTWPRVYQVCILGGCS